MGFGLTTLVGCKRDLGECNLDGQTADGHPIDGPAAFDIAFRSTDGLPMYEGQALVQSTCGDGSFCHAPAAVGADRFGVPAGLNFDVDLACTDESQEPTCAQPIQSCAGDQASTAYCERLNGLQDNQNQVRNWAEGMIQEMRRGAMPPGEAGQRVQNNIPWLRKSDGSELPPIESGEAQEIVRNWLACQAPVIARTLIPPSAALELEPCNSIDSEICVYNGPQGGLPRSALERYLLEYHFHQMRVVPRPLERQHGPEPGQSTGREHPRRRQCARSGSTGPDRSRHY